MVDVSGLGWAMQQGNTLPHTSILIEWPKVNFVYCAAVTLGVGGLRELPLAQVPPRRVAKYRSTNRSHPSQSLTYSYNRCFQFGFVQYSDLVRPGQSRDPFGGSN